MDDDSDEDEHDPTADTDHEANPGEAEVARLRDELQARVTAASLRTEAVRAGMIDLDGLKLIDLTKVCLDENDMITDGRKIMADLRKAKPWLFGNPSTSSGAIPPVSQPIRARSAMEMTDEEYSAARTAVTKYRF